ncbi:MAG: hypothetical protein JST80_08910 [Bdellovibrionales bacterium]|nr:hypothetical protein [Bdellovibrionales bacterium]
MLRNQLRTVTLLSVATLMLSSCAPILSKRTDEQAWIEYMQDLKSKREPASNAQPEKFSEISVRGILLSCNKSPQIEACYRQKVTVSFDSAFKNDPSYRKLQKEFLSQYSYDRVFAEVQSFHQVLLSGMELRAVDHIRDLHEKCGDRDEIGVTIHSFGPFLGGDTEIPKGYYSCLNDEIEKDEDQLLSETTERLGLTIVTPEAKQWIRERQIDPVYEKYTHDFFQKQMSLEKKEWDASADEIKDRIETHESLHSAVKRLSTELRGQYKFLPVEIYLTKLYKETKRQ